MSQPQQQVEVRQSHLSPLCRELLNTIREVRFGYIENLAVKQGEPMITAQTRVVAHVKLGTMPPTAAPQADFVLCTAMVHLFENLRSVGTGVVPMLEFRNGLPFTLHVEHSR